MGGVNQEEWEEMEKIFKKEISENLKREIKKKYNRQKDFASVIGIAESTIFKWTNGRVAPDIFYIYKICKILEISIEDIMGSFYLEKEKKDDYKKIHYNLTDEEIITIKQLIKKM